MLPERSLCHSERDGVLVPHFLLAHDEPWLRALLELHESLAGKPRREWHARMRLPLPRASPPGKRRMAAHVLGGLARDRSVSAVVPQLARSATFTAAAPRMRAREDVLVEAACVVGASVADLMSSLFADLPDERIVPPPPADLSPGELALRTNLALAQGLIHRSSRVELMLDGESRRIVRHAKLQGLICNVMPSGETSCRLALSGPFSLFRNTLVYGRALGGLVPLLSWCTRFELRARCTLRSRELDFELRSGDPIFPSAEPRRYDSRVEERFAHDFRRQAPEWEVLREPRPVEAAGALLFPDFAIWRRSEPERRWLVEIVGWWTPEYLATKLERWRAAAVDDLILCIDEQRNCSRDDVPPDAAIVRYRRRVDVAAVLEATRGRGSPCAA